MMEPDTTQAIEVIRQGNLTEGAKILSQVIKTNPDDETAWLWMSACVTDSDKKIYCLNKVIQINPTNTSARKGLSALGVEVPPLETPSASATFSYRDLTDTLGSRPSVTDAVPAPVEEEKISVPMNGGSFADAVRQMQSQMNQEPDDTQSFATGPAEPLAPAISEPLPTVGERAIMLEDFSYAIPEIESAPMQPEEPLPLIDTPVRPTRRKRGKNNWLLGIIVVLLIILLVFVLIAKFVVHAI
jgi:hypothetical protein